MQQIVKQANKAHKDNGQNTETVEAAREQFYIMGIVYQHIQSSKNDCGKQSHAVGNMQKIHPAVHVPVEEKYQQIEDEGKNITRFHAGRFHQRPGCDKALEQVQQ